MKSAGWLKVVRAICLLRRRVSRSDNPLLLAALDRAGYEAGYMLGQSLEE